MEKTDFIAYIAKDGVIWARGYGQNDTIVGYDLQEYNTLKADRDNCYSKAEKYLSELYESGIRQKPVSPEQAAAEQSKINQQMMTLLTKLSGDMQNINNEMQILKKNNNSNTNTDNASNELL